MTHIQHKISETQMVVIKDDTITELNREKVSGVSPSGKAWSRWQKQSMQTYSWKSGHLNRYTMQRLKRVEDPRRTRVNFRCVNLMPIYVHGSPFFTAVGERLGMNPLAERWDKNNLQPMAQEIRYQQYPLLRENPNWRPVAGMTPLLRAPSLQEGVRRYFGSTRYRKDLVKKVAGESLAATKYLHQFRGYVPVDWMVGVSFGAAVHDIAIRDFRPLLNAFTPKTVKHLLEKTDKATGSNIEDSLNSFRLIRQVDPMWSSAFHYADWVEVHDVLASTQRKLEHANKIIPQTDVAKAVDGLVVSVQTSDNTTGQLIVRSAKETYELIEWGTLMANCIGGYQYSALDGSDSLFGVYSGDRLIANMQIRSGRIQQLFGKFNAQLPTSQDQAIRQIIIDKLLPSSSKKSNSQYRAEIGMF